MPTRRRPLPVRGVISPNWSVLLFTLLTVLEGRISGIRTKTGKSRLRRGCHLDNSHAPRLLIKTLLYRLFQHQNNINNMARLG